MKKAPIQFRRPEDLTAKNVQRIIEHFEELLDPLEPVELQGSGGQTIIISSGGSGGGSPVTVSLDGLSDVTILSPADNELLAYDSVTGEWINQTAGEAGLALDADVLKKDGSVALTANWDAGNFKITANQLESDVAAGTAPLIVASNTVVANLNADLLDGNEASAFALAAHTHDDRYYTETELDAGQLDNRYYTESEVDTLLAGKQPLDSDLTALAALATTGLISRTGSGAVATRTLTAGSTKLSVSNGDGVAGNPTLDVVQANIDHDALTNFVANEHIDWTNATQNLLTSGRITVGSNPATPRNFNVRNTADHCILDFETNVAAKDVDSRWRNNTREWSLTSHNSGEFRFRDVTDTFKTVLSLITGGYWGIVADRTSDTAPSDDTTQKKISLQKLASAPTNAAYVAFANNPGTDTFYLVLEEGTL